MVSILEVDLKLRITVTNTSQREKFNTNRVHIQAVVCSETDSRMTSERCKNKTLSTSRMRVVNICSYHILSSSVYLLINSLRLNGGGGGGFYSNGRSGTNFGGAYGTGGEGGRGFIQGGAGGRGYIVSDVGGGFGGGGGGGTGEGGGGGYSGGASGDYKWRSCAGGGGSYNSGNNQDNKEGYRANGHGYVKIKYLN